MKKLLLLLIILSIIISCSPQKRLNLLAKNHPELFKVDTIFKYDTIRFLGSRVDTFLQVGITPDTVFMVKDNQVIKYFNNGKTVYLEGVVKTVDRIIKYPVQVKAPIITKTVHKIPFWVYFVFGFSALAILGLLFRK